MKRDVILTPQFKNDYKQLSQRHFNLDMLDAAIRALASGEPLPPKYGDHPLPGLWSEHRICYIMSGWVIVYFIAEDGATIVLSRTGTRRELFGD